MAADIRPVRRRPGRSDRKWAAETPLPVWASPAVFGDFEDSPQGILAKGEGMEVLYEIKGQGVGPRGWPAAWPWITTSSSY